MNNVKTVLIKSVREVEVYADSNVEALNTARIMHNGGNACAELSEPTYQILTTNSISEGKEVEVTFPYLTIRGIIVGKDTTDVTESHIIKCIDGQLPNETYFYDTFVAPLSLIRVLD